MKDNLNVSVGSGAIAIGNKATAVGQDGRIINAQNRVSGDLLAAEFAKLRGALLSEAKTAEHYMAIGQVSSAEIAAKASDSSGVSKALSAMGTTGKWVYGICKNIGANLAADVLQKQLGL